MSGMAAPVIVGEDAAEITAKVREVIALGWAKGYDGAAISDLVRTVVSLYAWDADDHESLA